ncbi:MULTISPECIES: SPJ_0845 family protein [Streptococcus]|uniref:ABC transporter ATP-binding protein n=1 Tax=Streptococcus pacificus TaxID=2740577 RepID=A0ABS0ZGN6_9STRE|nr:MULTISPECIES: SPJ_0845 family protein [Streptococcus]MBJ8325174.1 ABC transporter ATP-binding protein [Streptococcus pacificus]MCR8967186.1 SPJ_0845 family protein [Streptococcus zalophi]
MAITHKKQDDLEKMLENFATLPTATKPSPPDAEKKKEDKQTDKK